MFTAFFLQELNWNLTLHPFPITVQKRLDGGGVFWGRRKGGSEGVHKWVLVCLLRRADIIKDSPCVLPLLSSKGMLAPGSSASYCVALAEKRRCTRLWTAKEEGAREQAVFPIYQQGGGYTNNSAMCMQTFLPHCLILSLSHTLPGSLTLSIFLSPTQYLSPLPPLSLFTSSKPPLLFLLFHFFAVPSPCLLCCVFVP